MGLPVVFSLKIRLSISVILRSSAVSTALVDGVVLEEVFVSSVVLEVELSEKVTRALVDFDLLDLPCGMVEMALIELFFEN